MSIPVPLEAQSIQVADGPSSFLLVGEFDESKASLESDIEQPSIGLEESFNVLSDHVVAKVSQEKTRHNLLLFFVLLIVKDVFVLFHLKEVLVSASVKQGWELEKRARGLEKEGDRREVKRKEVAKEYSVKKRPLYTFFLSSVATLERCSVDG